MKNRTSTHILAAILYPIVFMSGMLAGNYNQNRTLIKDQEEIKKQLREELDEVYLQITIIGRQITTLINRELWEENPDLQKRWAEERAKYIDPEPTVEQR